MRNTILSSALAATLMVTSQASHAAEVTINATLGNYSGPRAYAVIYLTDQNGNVHDTFHVAGTKSKYYRHLRDWARGASRSQTPVHSVTGASVGSGRTLSVRANIADSLIDAGYQIRIDTSVEDVGDYPRSAVLTLGQQTSVPGRGLISSLSIN